MKNLFTPILFLCLLFIGMNLKAQRTTDPSPADQKAARMQSAEMYKHANITYAVIPSLNNSWGYNILVDNKLTITQPVIPAVQGNSGFKNRVDAEQVALLMIQKMKSGEFPPAISIEELKKLNVIK